MKGRQSHESLLRELIEYFESKKIKIHYANYPGYKKPMEIKRHAPDIIGIHTETGQVYIGEAKLCSELTDQITKEEFYDFPKTVITTGKSAGKLMQFYLAVPSDCASKIKEVFNKSDITWSDNIQVVGF
ncbi:hypothetical protein C6988_00690 [Nitrosopumilus sp. b1]|uniref:hypothetical protein n=1 Tax=Nitrosopumilus sp. b1 TaxID=2109907 RepID=UPI0015F3ABFE|nr:hypothetical protein [Nitrosopumilus sp. b1]KAF6243964.1 hypothetical protein C6988_00690 [Nitrosopumilus sp. b1]